MTRPVFGMAYTGGRRRRPGTHGRDRLNHRRDAATRGYHSLDSRSGQAVDEGTRREMLALLPRLRRFAVGLTASADEGDELMQATVERAIRHIDKWQPGTRLDSWMFQIARNLNLNNLRARKVRGAHLNPVDLDEVRGEDGQRVVESKLTLEAVRRFLGRLPEEQRVVLLLVCVEGLSYREVADATGVPVGTVTSRLARARITLRALVDGAAGPFDGAGGDLE